MKETVKRKQSVAKYTDTERQLRALRGCSLHILSLQLLFIGPQSPISDFKQKKPKFAFCFLDRCSQHPVKYIRFIPIKYSVGVWTCLVGEIRTHEGKLYRSVYMNDFK